MKEKMTGEERRNLIYFIGIVIIFVTTLVLLVLYMNKTLPTSIVRLGL